MTGSTTINLTELLASVDSGWRADCRHFIETGEASDEFLAFLDSDTACQAVVDQAFDAQAAAFSELFTSLQAATVRLAS